MKPTFHLKHEEYYWALKHNYSGKEVQYFIVQYSNEKWGEEFYICGTEESFPIDYFDEVLPEPIKNPFIK